MCVCFPRLFFSRRDCFWRRRTISCKYALHAVTERRRRSALSSLEVISLQIKKKIGFKKEKQAKNRLRYEQAIHGVSDLLHLLLPAGLWGALVGAHWLSTVPVLKTRGGRTFGAVAPGWWKVSPLHLRAATSVTLFKKQLWRTLLLCNFTYLLTCWQ